MINYQNLSNIAINAAKEAGQAIMKIYESDDFGLELKQDNSPLTKADTTAHQIIKENLKSTPFPVLSEEGEQIPYETRKNWKEFWLIDPLDGTKEFIKKNGEFTVNIALIRNGIPVWGTVYAPAFQTIYYGGILNNEAFKQVKTNDIVKLNYTESITKNKVRIIASRSHRNSETQAFINQFNDKEIISMGSSLKFMLLAENKADIYPRFAPTMEWDTAAAHAILKPLGYKIHQVDDNKNYITELKYNKKSLFNPYFLCER